MANESMKERMRRRLRESRSRSAPERAPSKSWRRRAAGSRVADGLETILRRLSWRTTQLGPPSDTFFAYELLRRNEVPGEILPQRQERCLHSPRMPCGSSAG